MTVVAKHELSPAPLDHMPLAGVKHRLELIQASGLKISTKALGQFLWHEEHENYHADLTRFRTRRLIALTNCAGTPKPHQSVQSHWNYA